MSKIKIKIQMFRPLSDHLH